MFGGLAKAVVMGRMVVVLFCFILGVVLDCFGFVFEGERGPERLV